MSEMTKLINSFTKLIESIKTCSPAQLVVVALVVAAPVVMFAI